MSRPMPTSQTFKKHTGEAIIHVCSVSSARLILRTYSGVLVAPEVSAGKRWATCCAETRSDVAAWQSVSIQAKIKRHRYQLTGYCSVRADGFLVICLTDTATSHSLCRVGEVCINNRGTRLQTPPPQPPLSGVLRSKILAPHRDPFP
jgi:hypothetical protein